MVIIFVTIRQNGNLFEAVIPVETMRQAHETIAQEKLNAELDYAKVVAFGVYRKGRGKWSVAQLVKSLPHMNVDYNTDALADEWLSGEW